MATKRVLLVVSAVVLTFVAVLGIGYAQAPAAPEAATGTQTSGWSMMEIIYASGWIGGVIILLSFVALGLIIEHFTSIKDEKLIPPDFVAALQTTIDEKKYQDATQLCEASDNYISRIMQVGLSEIRYGYDAMVETMVSVGEEESIKLNQKIAYLSLIGTLAPMLGLLGTVWGMIICFRQIASAPVTNASDLAKGIYMALVTTVQGLVVGIPTLFFFSFFQDRVTNIGLEAGAVCEELIRRFKPIKVAGVDVQPRPSVVKPAAGASQPTG